MNDMDPVAPAAPEPESTAPVPVRPDPLRPETKPPSMVDLLLNPRAFFEALEARPVGLRTPALIVLAVAIVAAITGYQVTGVVMSAMDIPGMEGLGGALAAIGALSTLIISLLLWVVWTAVFFAISMAFKGRGDFNRLLAYVGYGHLPQLIGGIVSTAITWSYLSDLQVPTITDPLEVQEWASGLAQHPTMQLATVVGALFLLWSANIWIFGVRTGRRLTTRDAAITVLVPVVLFILYTLYPLVA